MILETEMHTTQSSEESILINGASRQPLMLSIIIPAHNAADTLKRCVSSVMEGGVSSDLEILIVENGSTDDTLSAATTLYEKWPDTIRVLTSKTGVSNARNVGIDSARGEWILFLDADDRLSIAGMRTMVNRAAELSADILAGDIQRVYNNSQELHRYSSTPIIWNGETLSAFSDEVLKPQTFMGNAWGKVFNRSWLMKNGLRFNTALSLAEDAEFMLNCAIHMRKAAYLPVECYYYHLNMNSAVRRFKEELPGEYIAAIEAIHSILGQTDSAAHRQSFETFVLYHLLLIAVNYSFHPDNPRPLSEQLRCYRSLAKSEPFATALKRPNYRDFSLSRKVPLFFTARGFCLGALCVARVRHIMFKVK